MKKIAFLFALSALIVGCQHKVFKLELTDWNIIYHNQCYPATVPGFLHTDLMDNGLIEDPYYGTCEEDARWLDDRTWTYSTVIDCNSLPNGDSLWLVFEGLAGRATIATTYNFEEGEQPQIDGESLDFADNMFVEYRFPIFKYKGCSSITVEVIFNASPLAVADSIAEAEYGIPLPDQRAFTRIAPYQQGWDWGPKLPTCGIWKPVYITNCNKKECKNDNLLSANQHNNVELRQEQDSIGQCFAFYKDGKRFFAKGANWIPAHTFPVLNEELKSRYRMYLCAAKEANFNMIRVWGGGIYEHDYFFDLCDSLGLMVWMDFNFSTMLYPDNPEMLASIDQEARENIRRIAQHPCVVLWCGNNEVKNGWEDWGWQGVFNWTPDQRKRLEKALDTIFGYSGPTGNTSSTSILSRAVNDCDPLHRPYITTSPLYGWGHPECTTHGDSHYWGVWWGELPFEVFKEKTGRFMSEYGFQSYPLMSSIMQFCPADQLTITSPTLRSHQKHPRGLQIIDKAMKQYYGFDSQTLSLEDFAYVSQLLQAWGIGYGILCHLSDPRCDGTLYWQLNDSWPVASWSSIDYYGNWKALHYRVQKLYDDNVDLNYWTQYYSVYPKNRKYDKPKFKVSHSLSNDGSLTVTLSAENDIYDAYIETVPHVNGHFDKNFVDLKAGETVTAKFIPAPGQELSKTVKITVRTLNDLY